jgi:hypothetical protein
LELLEKWNVLQNLVCNSILDVLLVGDEVSDAILVRSDRDESVFAEDYHTTEVFGWIFVLFKHDTGVGISHKLQWLEYLALLLDLSEEIRDLLSSLGLLLLNFTVA